MSTNFIVGRPDRWGCVLAVGIAVVLLVSCATPLTYAPEPLDGRGIREQVLREVTGLPSLMKWVNFADPASAGLTFEPGPQKGTLDTAAGKWPEQRAAHIFHGLLQGEPVNPPETGFTVAFWFRLRDLERVDRRGYKRSSGGIMAVGSGYYDGWRLAAMPNSLGLSLSIGAPEKGVRTVSVHGLIQPEKWHHVACTWDRTTARIYIDGTAQTEAVINLPYTMPEKAPTLRIGECGFGLGVLDFEIADLGFFSEALPPEIIKRLGDPMRILEERLAQSVGRARKLADGAKGRPQREQRVREAYTPLANLTAEQDSAYSVLNTRALARLGIADSFRRERRYDEARREYERLVKDDAFPEHFRNRAMFAHADTWRDQLRYTEARREYERIRDAFTGKHEHYRVTALQRLADIEGLIDGEPFRDVRTRRIERLSRPVARFFVSPNGNDANPGTRKQPFRTLEKARDAVRKLKAAGPLPEGGIAVVLAGGIYPRTQSFALGPEDSGTAAAPILYRSASGERAILRGGRAVDGFRPLSHPVGLKRIPKSAQSHVLQVDIKAAGITDLGTFHRRGYGCKQDYPSHLELFFKNRPMPLARWPNESPVMAEGFTTVKDLIGEKTADFRGKMKDLTNGFIYGDPRHENWMTEPEVWLFGYWGVMYAANWVKVASIDPKTHQVRIEPPLPPYAFIKGGPYYAVNVLCELDAPGEWYLDKASGMLFFWPPSRIGKGDAVVSLLEAPMLELNGVSHVAFRGLTLEAGRLHGATIQGGEDVILAGCVIRDMGVSGVLIDGGRNHVVIGCDLEYLGDGCVKMKGGDTAKLIPSGHLVENCHLHHFDRWNRSGYKAGVIQDGVGSRISHCLIHDGPHQAVRVKGNDHILEYTEIHDTCYEAGEMGSYYMYGSKRVLGERGQLVRFNYWHHLPWDETFKHFACAGRHGLHIDHMNGDITLYGNLFWKCDTKSGAFFSGGPDNTVENNVFYECSSAINLGDRSWVYEKVNKAPRYVLDAYLRQMKVSEPPWSVRYPRLKTYPEKATDLSVFLVGNVICRNIIVKCDSVIAGSRKAHKLARIEHNWRKGDPGFVSPEKGNLRLRPDSPAFTAIGFEPIPTDRIGLYNDELRATWPVRHPAGNHKSVFAAKRIKTELPSCRALPRTNPITIDGKLTAEEWDGLDKATAVAIKRSPADAPATAPPSYAWIRRDKDHLYIGILNEVNPDVPLTAAESWWGGDMVEVIIEGKIGVGTGGWWLDEKPHGPLFYLVGNHQGKFDSICIEGLPKMRAEVLRNSVRYAANADTPGRWTAEWKIPLALMCIDVEKTEFCNFNIGVCKPGTRSKTGAKLTGNSLWVAWSGTAGPNWQVWNAGRLILKGK
ncbi:MAG: hypothetical protein GXP25_00700 [Planctomycetes bacterium]|nr:hypothetical protein [Planctomycetota bacterium]